MGGGGLSFHEEKLVCEKLVMVTVSTSLPPTVTTLKSLSVANSVSSSMRFGLGTERVLRLQGASDSIVARVDKILCLIIEDYLPVNWSTNLVDKMRIILVDEWTNLVDKSMGK